MLQYLVVNILIFPFFFLFIFGEIFRMGDGIDNPTIFYVCRYYHCNSFDDSRLDNLRCGFFACRNADFIAVDYRLGAAGNDIHRTHDVSLIYADWHSH